MTTVEKTRPSINKFEVLKLARGKWLDIIPTIAPFASEAAQTPGTHHPCPIHGGRDGFRFYRDADVTGGGVCNSCGSFPDGFALVQWLTGGSFYDALKDVSDIVGGAEFLAKPARPVPPQETAEQIAIKDKGKIGRLRSAWRDSLPATAPAASPIKNYLNSRGLTDVPGVLRYHPSMCYRHADGETENLPCMLALIQASDGTSVSLHRTYLLPEGKGKADVPSPKKMMEHTSTTSPHGSAIRLYELQGETLGLAEGIETSIACHLGTGIPVWPTISAVFMETFVPPEGVTRLVVFADRDRSMTGASSAMKLAANLREIRPEVKVEIHLPPSAIPDGKKGIDWHDEYRAHGKRMFPVISH